MMDGETKTMTMHNRIREAALAAAAICAVLLMPAPAGAWPWAESVIIYNPGPGIWQGVYRDHTRILGRPWGAGVNAPDNSSVVTLGDGGTVTVEFGDRVVDDHRNPHGLDFIVFSNAIWAGGDPTVRYQEPAFVEVSEDGVNWYLILPNILPADLKGAPQAGQDTGTSATVLRGYAEYTPTLPLPGGLRPEEFYTIPDRPSRAGDPQSLLIDEGSGGGDAFDIKWAVLQASPGVPMLDGSGGTIPANLDSIRFLRITDALAGDYQDPLGEISAEIDAVASVIPPKQPFAEAIREANDVIVRFDDAVVVRSNADGSVYAHALDGSAGTRIAGAGAHAPGTRLSVLGRLYHYGDETVVYRIYCDPIGTAPVPRIVSVPLHTLTAPVGLSPAGMVVRTWGRASTKGYTGMFKLTGAAGGSALVTSPVQPPDGSLVRVTGGSARGPLKTSMYLQSASDLEVLAPK
jgi:hypothetical protein